MADERIYITEVKEGDVCPFEEKCEGFYKLCEGCNVLPTRQEVIDKMADAIIKKIKEMGKGATPIFLAEAALNSLLEEQK